MRALELICRFIGALPFIVAVLAIGLMWALCAPVVWAIGKAKRSNE